MPKKTDPRVVVRLSPEDHARLKELAEGANEPLATFMRNAALGRHRHREVVEAVKAGAEVRVEAGSMVPKPATAVEGRPFKCPVYGCAYEADSPAARCGPHGRTVVPH